MGRKYLPTKYKSLEYRPYRFVWEMEDNSFVEGFHSHLEDLWLMDLYKQDKLFEIILSEAGRNGVRRMEADELPDPVEAGYDIAPLFDTWFTEEDSEDWIPETLRGV